MAKSKKSPLKFEKVGKRWVTKDNRTPAQVAMDYAKDENRRRRAEAKASGTLTNRPKSGVHGPTAQARRRAERRQGKIHNPNDSLHRQGQ